MARSPAERSAHPYQRFEGSRYSHGCPPNTWPGSVAARPSPALEQGSQAAAGWSGHRWGSSSAGGGEGDS